MKRNFIKVMGFFVGGFPGRPCILGLIFLFFVGCGGDGEGLNLGGPATSATTDSATTPVLDIPVTPSSTTISPPSAPNGTSVVAGNGWVTITWDAVRKATSYNIYMASGPGVTKSNYSSLTDGMQQGNISSPYTHKGLMNNKTYYFVVTAINTDGESVESPQVSATPSAATAIAARGSHTCALLSDGMIKCWGHNYYGQLGDATAPYYYYSTPVIVSGITNATAVSAGWSYHTCALLSDGLVKCWGYNGIGQLGNGTTTDSSTAILVSGITNATAIAAGDDHNCALLSDETIKCWGYSYYGQLGDGRRREYSRTPVLVSGITDATAIAAGGHHTCALLSDSTVKCWGYNSGRDLGNGTRMPAMTPLLVSGITNATAIAAGENYTCALLSDNTVKCWGRNSSGQLGDGTRTDSTTPVFLSGITNATIVATGAVHACVFCFQTIL